MHKPAAEEVEEILDAMKTAAGFLQPVQVDESTISKETPYI